MKKAGITLFAVLVLLQGLAAFAATTSTNAVLVDIPFSFYAGNQQMPAGKYIVDMPRMGGFAAGTMLLIQSEDGEFCQYVLSNRISGNTADTDLHIEFTKYGDTYFISKVRTSELGAELNKTSLQKRTAREFLTVTTDAAVEVVHLVAPMPKAK